MAHRLCRSKYPPAKPGALGVSRSKRLAGSLTSTMFDPVRVKCLQTALNVLGANPPLDIDGEYGPMTKDAVLEFQKTHDLVADGWAGDATHDALQLALSKKPKTAGQP
jgi:murein L,D-transpeptidase YcbB/YkuD